MGLVTTSAETLDSDTLLDIVVVSKLSESKDTASVAISSLVRALG